MLNPQLAWYVAGPVLGLCVVAVRLIFNARLGVTGGYSSIVGTLQARQARLRLACLVRGRSPARRDVLRARGRRPRLPRLRLAHRQFRRARSVGPVLLGAGVLVGYGAKLAGGCTSGNGLSGNVDALASGAGGDRNVLRDRDRGELPDEGGVLGVAARGGPRDRARLRGRPVLERHDQPRGDPLSAAVRGLLPVPVLRARPSPTAAIGLRTAAPRKRRVTLDDGAARAPPHRRQPRVRRRLGHIGRLPGPDRNADRPGHRLGALDARRRTDRGLPVLRRHEETEPAYEIPQGASALSS